MKGVDFRLLRADGVIDRVDVIPDALAGRISGVCTDAGLIQCVFQRVEGSGGFVERTVQGVGNSVDGILCSVEGLIDGTGCIVDVHRQSGKLCGAGVQCAYQRGREYLRAVLCLGQQRSGLLGGLLRCGDAALQ